MGNSINRKESFAMRSMSKCDPELSAIESAGEQTDKSFAAQTRSSYRVNNGMRKN